MEHEAWTAKTGEDRLLLRYWRERAGGEGAIFTEVGIAGKQKPSKWRDGSTKRRLDGVRVLGSGIKPNVYTRRGTTQLLSDLAAGTLVELIEVKQGLSEEVLGQCLVGRALFAEQYPHLRVARTVALCKVADPRMKEICSRADVNVHVEVVPNDEKPGALMTNRVAYLFNDRWVAAIEGWRADVCGLFFTRIPLGSTSVNLIRVPEGPDLLATYDTTERLLAATRGQPVTLVEVRRKLSRGVVGRVVAHAAMLTNDYRIDVQSKLIFVAKTDEAIAWACGRFGIEVRVVPNADVGVDDDDQDEDVVDLAE